MFLSDLFITKIIRNKIIKLLFIIYDIRIKTFYINVYIILFHTSFYQL